MSNTTYSHRILRTYGLLVDFEGEPHRSNVPSPLEGRKAAKETMEQWTQRVLGNEVSKVRIYRPTRVKGDTLLFGLTESHDATLVLEIVRCAVRKKGESAKEKIQEIEETLKSTVQERRARVRELRNSFEEEYSEKLGEIMRENAFLPLDELQELVEDMESDLHPSVREWVMTLNPGKAVKELSGKSVAALMLRRMSLMAKDIENS
jgi:vacuolar-type H+-ATPase subunit H